MSLLYSENHKYFGLFLSLKVTKFNLNEDIHCLLELDPKLERF